MKIVNHQHGERFGKLAIISKSKRKEGKSVWWICRCDCGRIVVLKGRVLRFGGTNSCGCLKLSNEQNVKHGSARRNNKTATYQAWCRIKKRCYNTKHDKYMYYGGRGITVCWQWYISFECFLRDMGSCPDGLTIDRIDPNGNYEPSNCRWADWHTQRINQRRNHG